ncbi:MAG: sigma 54-interacting transcriptional regulator [Chitinophaga sp.]|uniref:sigma 54-interacting response regulator n=1 Tax=Chitinophaga sp. TaxID=1869181 RepID=UPI001B0CE9F1|nr:sigma 54-interacting response regulator [Chitinophaga sp.]MBO9729695.1 sigma 54-interacting transcriptional regulator [Chitinophaga sp.]
MKQKILIVEDQFVEADYLRLMLSQAGYNVTGMARSMIQAEEMIKKERPDFVLLDIFLKGKQTGIDLAPRLADENIPFVYLSANSNEDVLTAAKMTQPYGFLVKPFREKDLLVTLEIAKYRHEHSLETRYRNEAGFPDKMKTIFAGTTDPAQKLLSIAMLLQSYMPFDYITIGFNEIGRSSFCGTSFLRTGFDEYQVIGPGELVVITGKSTGELAALQSCSHDGPDAVFYNEEAFEKSCHRSSLHKLFADTFQLRSQLFLPLPLTDERSFNCCLFSRRADAYHMDHVALFDRVQRVLTRGMEELVSKMRYVPAAGAAPEGNYRTPENHHNPVDFEGIVGKSHLLLNVFDHVSQVARSATSVLLLGESGTGKEKIADCIHNLSDRKGKPLVKVNCASLPPGLIESELFGHEKGAFTGANEKRIGRFEKADKGTIFLDEIGEMPVELQVKLLRALQEKEIERIGSTETIKIDVRIIAATNKNLEKEVAEGRFRLDLYYRLNVFPITLPPLRERKEDIPALAYYFMNQYKLKAGKKISGISEDVLKKMMSYHWPGNIRELEHLIERNVLLTRGHILDDISLPIPFKKEQEPGSDDFRMKTIHENERDYIISVLKKCNGRIWGPGAAAEILSINPSTLKSKMKKLGIKKEYIGE